MTAQQTTTASGRPAVPGAGAGAGARSGAARAVARLRRADPTVGLAVLVLAVVAAWALVPGLFTAHDPLVGVPAEKLQPPSAAHPFGTDALGRDLLARVIHGAVHSLTSAVIAVAVGLVVGTALGVLAGSAGRLVDDVLMRVVDVLLAVPALLLSLSVIILLGFGTTNVAIAVGVGSVAAFARLTRAEVVRLRRTDYVEAAFGSGGSYLGVLRRHVLPGAVGAVAALAVLQLGTAILAIATLGFLGYGAPPPTPEWGLLIAEGRNYIATSWWLTTLPGLVLIAVVLAAHRISLTLRRN
ncbi:ABC transporter permease [Georgenia sp. TF02-10]|uniref:ABC transporter permease n=1 Tax=Georgenia sp. TF02-10 TaxID=2917725 RepID=UPI001FA7B04F|nr:ABC transporter permease [Georgenia sp. TF02-10]UNX53813.1 ABC transporter permease [Georgenia sp. TF02-10]